MFDTPRANWALAERDHPPPARPRFQAREITTPRAHNRRDMDVHERARTTLRQRLPARPPNDALAECAYARPIPMEPT